MCVVKLPAIALLSMPLLALLPMAALPAPTHVEQAAAQVSRATTMLLRSAETNDVGCEPGIK
jgi:hypothetical protein